MTAAEPPGRAPRRSRRVRTLTRRDKIVLVLMLGLPLLLDLAFIWAPALTSVLFSFTRWNGIGTLRPFTPCPPPPTPSVLRNGCFVGLENYREAVTIYPQFWPAVEHNVIWLLVFILVATPLGMLFAVLIDRGIRGSRIYKSVLFLPVMLSLALIGIVWEFMYSQNYGLINSVLGKTSGPGAIDWLGDPRINLWAVLVAATWRQAGYVMVLYLAGLKAVDTSLREAAAIDGASEWQAFWHVVFPVLRPINVIILVVTVIESLRAFDLVYIINRGSNGLELLSVLVTNNIVGEISRIGFGSALGVVLLVISLVPICFFLYQNFRREEAS